MFSGLSGRLQLIRITVIAGLFAGMALSPLLWSGTRYFPHITLIPLHIPYPYDLLLPYLLALSGMLAIVYPNHRAPVIGFITTAILLLLLDLNRLQPWFYQYVLFMFILGHGKAEGKFRLMRLMLAATYLWSGIHKLNGAYFDEIVPWLSSWPESQFSFLPWEGVFSIAPFIEIVFGISIVLRRFTMATVPLAIVSHLLILWITGPFGQNHNSAIWPWNIAQIALLLLLFIRTSQFRITDTSWNFAFAGKALVVLFFIMPAFNLVGLWPSYLSFNLYSGTPGYGYLAVGGETVRLTPAELRREYLSDLDSTHRVEVHAWSFEELNVPPFPEKITYRRVADYFRNFTDEENDVLITYYPRRLPWKPSEPVVE